MSPAERQLQPLLEKDYREDVKAYMYEMQVRDFFSFPFATDAFRTRC
jgi:hypothetical protein